MPRSSTGSRPRMQRRRHRGQSGSRISMLIPREGNFGWALTLKVDYSRRSCSPLTAEPNSSSTHEGKAPNARPTSVASGLLDHRIASPQILVSDCPVAELFSSATGAGRSSSVVDGLSLNGSVDSRASDAEQLRKLGGGMRAREVDFH